MMEGAERTGELRLQWGTRTIICYVRGGDISFVTCLDPIEYADGAAVDHAAVAPNALDRAYAEQRATGRPFYLSLAESGSLPPCDLRTLLWERGKALLLTAAAQSSVQFVFTDRVELPSYEANYGRRLSVAQLRLERIRRMSAGAAAEAALSRSDVVLERTSGFARKLHRLELSIAERAILALVDGKRTLAEIFDRAGIAPQEATVLLYRMMEVDLLAKRARPHSAGANGALSVMIQEPDIDGFQRPLAALLRAREPHIDLVPLEMGRDTMAAVLERRPCLVILNASGAGKSSLAADTARALRSAPELSDLPLVAVLDLPEERRAEELAIAGFDLVLTKPIGFSDIERLLVA
jgi:hypothetical protein